MKSLNDNLGKQNTTKTALLETVASLADVFHRHSVKYALIGGVCVAVRGNRRYTDDVDFLISASGLKLTSLLNGMVEAGCVLDVASCIRHWNDTGMFVMRSQSGVQVDCVNAVLPLFHRVMERATDEPIEGNDIAVRVADVEGILIMKLIAFRPLDQEDIRSILTAQRQNIDLEWVRSEARAVGLPSEQIAQFDAMVTAFYRV